MGESRGQDVTVDCEEGRKSGCATYCCRLLVRYAPEERILASDGVSFKNCADKDPATGLCSHMDSSTWRCLIWETRPRVCREFTCEGDPRLRRVQHDGGFRSLLRLVQPLEPWEK